ATRTGGQLVLANAQLGQVNAQLAHANNRVCFGIQTLGRLKNRLFQQIAALRIQLLPYFMVERMKTLRYINTVGIDLLDDAGAPPGQVRAMEVLRSCMKDEAARWFDAKLTGKNWELSSIRLVAAANGGAGATLLQGILLDQAFMHMRTNFPTVVEERLQIRFSNLYQEQGEPVRSYYKRVERAGDIVGYNRIMVTDQFYRGLLPENVVNGRISSTKR
ncbi:hypothetical protein RhiirA5_440115, partial [Rhizophagus irregularis]